MLTSLFGVLVGRPEPGKSLDQSRTNRGPFRSRAFPVGVLTGGFFAMAALAAGGPSWPPFLPPAAELPTPLVGRIEHVWSDPTLTRTVRGRSAKVPFAVYTALVDAPVITANAARHLGLAKYEVRRVGDDTYVADDGDGASGTYQVLARDPTRRVLLSWGAHRGRLLGTVRGSALTVLEFKEAGDEVDPQLTTYVRIDNAMAAGLARTLMAIFGHLADRRLTAGFTTTAKVAEWSVRHPAEFCAWLQSEPSVQPDLDIVAAVVPDCVAITVSSARR